MPRLKDVICVLLMLGCGAAAADDIAVVAPDAHAQHRAKTNATRTARQALPSQALPLIHPAESRLIAIAPGPQRIAAPAAKDAALYVSSEPFEDFLARTEAGSHRWSAYAIAAASANNLPPGFLLKLLAQESAFTPTAVSRTGAMGIAQFMPGTAIAVGLRDPFEPVAAINAAAKHLAALYARFGNLGLAAAAYNAGPVRVSGWLAGQKSLPQETIDYVWRVTGVDANTWAAKDKKTAALIPSAVALSEPATRPKATKSNAARKRPAKIVSASELCQAINAAGSTCRVQRSY